VSAALILTAIFAVLRFILLASVVTVAMATRDDARRRTALAIVRILRPLAGVPDLLKRR